MTTSAPTVQAAEQRASRSLSRADYDRFLPLVRRTAMRLARRIPAHITVADLVGYGWIGLMEAFNRASSDMPANELEAYALYRVRGAMLDYLRQLDASTRRTRRSSRDVTRAIKDLSQSLGRPPHEEEIAERMGVTLEQYRATLADVARAGMTRLEMIDVDDLGSDVEDDGPDAPLRRKQMVAAVAEGIETLPPKLKQVLALYYQEECTLKEIGAVLGVSESRVSQLHTEAVHRLRASIGKE
jgi:RNA polymerase sigma factor FliA